MKSPESAVSSELSESPDQLKCRIRTVYYDLFISTTHPYMIIVADAADMEQFGKLLHICNVELLVIAPHDKFTMYSLLSWFTLFWRKINFVAIYSLLCGAEMNSTVLSVEEKEREQICCLWIWPDSKRFDLAGVKIRKSSFWGCSPGGGAFNW